MKTSELIGRALDWAVAKCEGDYPVEVCYIVPKFSTDWAQGGPIIEREEMAVAPNGCGEWRAETYLNAREYSYGPTPLIAVMRCLVSSKLGDEVEVPEELL